MTIQHEELPPPRVTAFYRTCSGENRAARPGWYSKTLCLASFLAALAELRRACPAECLILHDGPLQANRRWSTTLVEGAGHAARVIERPSLGNAASCLDAIHLACSLPRAHIVIFAEDDYLWLPQSLINLIEAMLSLPCDYVTPYDHPDHYAWQRNGGYSLAHWNDRIYLAGDRHWRSHESTCMTFATTVGTLREDVPYFEVHCGQGRGVPDDSGLFRHLQGLGQYADQVWTTRRLLLGPIPSLATHSHLPYLSPFVDWDAEAERVADELKVHLRMAAPDSVVSAPGL